MLEPPFCFFRRSVLQYLRQLKLFLTVNHDHRRLLLIVSIVIARPQHADMKYWMDLVVLRLLGQIQISGQPGVPTIVEIERAHIVVSSGFTVLGAHSLSHRSYELVGKFRTSVSRECFRFVIRSAVTHFQG
ncbi:TPA: hypothetical protein ACH3X1_005808 [Trebouxia sp. C0004]